MEPLLRRMGRSADPSSARLPAKGKGVRTHADAEGAMALDPHDLPRRRHSDGLDRRISDRPTEPSPNGKPRRRDYDGWLDRWVATTSDLTQAHHDAPDDGRGHDEQVGRKIRRDRWLTDWVMQLPRVRLDEEIIATVPEYLAKWGTHSRGRGCWVTRSCTPDRRAAH